HLPAPARPAGPICRSVYSQSAARSEYSIPLVPPLSHTCWQTPLSPLVRTRSTNAPAVPCAAHAPSPPPSAHPHPSSHTAAPQTLCSTFPHIDGTAPPPATTHSLSPVPAPPQSPPATAASPDPPPPHIPRPATVPTPPASPHRRPGPTQTPSD